MSGVAIFRFGFNCRCVLSRPAATTDCDLTEALPRASTPKFAIAGRFRSVFVDLGIQATGTRMTSIGAIRRAAVRQFSPAICTSVTIPATTAGIAEFARAWCRRSASEVNELDSLKTFGTSCNVSSR